MAAVIGAVVARLQASTAVTGLATGGIYNNVPQGTPYPYVEVTSPTDRRQDTFGRFGSETLIDVKTVSQAHGDQEALAITEQCIGALDFQLPATTGHSALGVAFESGDRFREVVNGVVTRHHVATFRVWTEQSTS